VDVWRWGEGDVELGRGAFAMGVGDLLIRAAIFSKYKNVLVFYADNMVSDYLTSNIHRVHLPPLQDLYIKQERMTGERYSIPYFVNPKRSTVMG